MQLLDNLAGQKPQLTALELFMLTSSVTAAASGPWIMGGTLTEFLAPTAAACKFYFMFLCDAIIFLFPTLFDSIVTVLSRRSTDNSFLS